MNFIVLEANVTEWEKQQENLNVSICDWSSFHNKKTSFIGKRTIEETR